MAISGAGGWIPSTGVYMRRGEVFVQPITQNKPRSIIYSDVVNDCAGNLAAAATVIRDGHTAQVDVRFFQLVKVCELVQSG